MPIPATAAALGALLVTGCAAAPAPPARTATTLKATPLDRVVARGKAQYAREVDGARVRSLLRRVARDRQLRRALATSDGTARAYVARRFPDAWYHWHISRLRITRGSTVIAERGVPFVVDGPRVKLRDRRGGDLGTLQVSLQDEIGFVRLMHRNHGVDVVVRGTRSVRSSLPAATRAALPARGTVTLMGRRYAVRSFTEKAWNNEPVTIWFLAAA